MGRSPSPVPARGHQPQGTSKSGSLAVSLPIAAVLGAVQPGDRVSGPTEASADPSDTACSF